MKRVLGSVLLLSCFSFGAYADEAYVFFKRINGFAVSEQNNEIEVSFSLKCYETLLEIVRLETIDKETGIITIHLGGWVADNGLLGCENSSPDERVVTQTAGYAYSGREFKISALDEFRRVYIPLPPPQIEPDC